MTQSLVETAAAWKLTWWSQGPPKAGEIPLIFKLVGNCDPWRLQTALQIGLKFSDMANTAETVLTTCIPTHRSTFLRRRDG